MQAGELKTKIFLDSGDAQETVEAMELLGYLDGQTTNPTLVAKNPEARRRLEQGQKFRPDEIWSFYKDVVCQISRLLPRGSVSVEVYADLGSTPEDLLHQARKFQTWIPNAHIKFPVTAAGLEAAQKFIAEGGRANMTLVFSQEQAAAVQAISRGCQPGQVFVSPFIGRLDDRGLNGMDLIRNCIRMYQAAESRVDVLAASVRSVGQLQECVRLGADIVTAPLKLIQDWSQMDFDLGAAGDYAAVGEEIGYRDLDTGKDWREYDIDHELTRQGLEKFAKDWNNLLA